MDNDDIGSVFQTIRFHDVSIGPEWQTWSGKIVGAAELVDASWFIDGMGRATIQDGKQAA